MRSAGGSPSLDTQEFFGEGPEGQMPGHARALCVRPPLRQLEAICSWACGTCLRWACGRRAEECLQGPEESNRPASQRKVTAPGMRLRCCRLQGPASGRPLTPCTQAVTPRGLPEPPKSSEAGNLLCCRSLPVSPSRAGRMLTREPAPPGVRPLAGRVGAETIAGRGRPWASAGKSHDCPGRTHLSKTAFLSLTVSQHPSIR